MCPEVSSEAPAAAQASLQATQAGSTNPLLIAAEQRYRRLHELRRNVIAARAERRQQQYSSAKSGGSPNIDADKMDECASDDEDSDDADANAALDPASADVTFSKYLELIQIIPVDENVASLLSDFNRERTATTGFNNGNSFDSGSRWASIATVRFQYAYL